MNTMRTKPRLLAVASLLFLALPVQGELTFTKIVDTNTPVPGGEGNFVYFGRPAIDGIDVAVASYVFTESEPIGIYKYVDGTLEVVADRRTLIPGTVRAFDTFHTNMSISRGNVAFLGRDSVSREGIYTDAKGITTIADTSTPIPGGYGNFAQFGPPWLEGQAVVFSGTDESRLAGIYLYDGGLLSCVADTTTLIPPDYQETFAGFSSPSIVDGIVAFKGTAADGSPTGIYVVDSGKVVRVVDDSTPLPNGGGSLAMIGAPTIDDNGDVAFRSRDSSGRRGVCTVIDSVLRKTADEDTSLPGWKPSANISDFGAAGIDEGNVAFSVMAGTWPIKIPMAVYADFNGAFSRIISRPDTIDGGRVTQSMVGRQCVSGNRIAFWVSYNSGIDMGIYVAYFCPGDLNGDHVVDSIDLTVLLEHIDTAGSRDEGDINGDHWIGDDDLEILLNNFGTVCPDGGRAERKQRSRRLPAGI